MTVQTSKTATNWNRTLTYFKHHSQEITLHLYIQYSGHIALPTVCLVQSSADAYSTDTGLVHSTSQICLHPHSTLCSSSAKSPSLPRPLKSLCYTPHTDSPWHDFHLLLSAGIICCLLHF